MFYPIGWVRKFFNITRRTVPSEIWQAAPFEPSRPSTHPARRGRRAGEYTRKYIKYRYKGLEEFFPPFYLSLVHKSYKKRGYVGIRECVDDVMNKAGVQREQRFSAAIVFHGYSLLR